jgi:hypothetical protein
MLKNIPLIASIISALTAITTSFRALGRSREDDFPTGPVSRQLKDLMFHILATIIWFGLSIVFAIPSIKERLSSSPDTSLLPLIVPFTMVVLVCCLIWWKTLSSRN